jgi:hypothetical protein
MKTGTHLLQLDTTHPLSNAYFIVVLQEMCTRVFFIFHSTPHYPPPGDMRAMFIQHAQVCACTHSVLCMCVQQRWLHGLKIDWCLTYDNAPHNGLHNAYTNVVRNVRATYANKSASAAGNTHSGIYTLLTCSPSA